MNDVIVLVASLGVTFLLTIKEILKKKNEKKDQLTKSNEDVESSSKNNEDSNTKPGTMKNLRSKTADVDAGTSGKENPNKEERSIIGKPAMKNPDVGPFVGKLTPTGDSHIVLKEKTTADVGSHLIQKGKQPNIENIPTVLNQAATTHPGNGVESFTKILNSNDKIGEFEKALSKIVGLADLKCQLRKWAIGMLLDQTRQNLGIKLGRKKMPHMAFLGNPGTGKTTVARILGNLLHSVGLLSSNKVIEVQRTDLVAQYIGHTGPKTIKKIQEAMGGVLFVDEAYRLVMEDSARDFGKEALEEIMSVMEDKNIMIIFAGYTGQMERVFSTNQGLRRRVAHTFQFDNFTCDELSEMLMLKMTKQDEKSLLYGFQLDPSCTMDAICEVIEKNSTQSMRNQMNGDLIDHMLVKAKESLDFRLSALESFTQVELITIMLDDLIVGLQLQAQSMKSGTEAKDHKSVYI